MHARVFFHAASYALFSTLNAASFKTAIFSSEGLSLSISANIASPFSKPISFFLAGTKGFSLTSLPVKKPYHTRAARYLPVTRDR